MGVCVSERERVSKRVFRRDNVCVREREREREGIERECVSVCEKMGEWVCVRKCKRDRMYESLCMRVCARASVYGCLGVRKSECEREIK